MDFPEAFILRFKLSGTKPKLRKPRFIEVPHQEGLDLHGHKGTCHNEAWPLPLVPCSFSVERGWLAGGYVKLSEFQETTAQKCSIADSCGMSCAIEFDQFDHVISRSSVFYHCIFLIVCSFFLCTQLNSKPSNRQSKRYIWPNQT